MAIVAAFHVALVSLVKWTTRWVPAVKIAAIGSADLILILALLALVGKFTDGLAARDDRSRRWVSRPDSASPTTLRGLQHGPTPRLGTRRDAAERTQNPLGVRALATVSV